MADFTSDVSKWCNEAKGLASDVFQAIAFDAVMRVQELTPVKTGFLRSNWTAIRKGDAEPVAGRVSPPGVAIADAEVGDVILIINPVAYARRIEFGFVGEDSLGRYYNQQGRHMMTQTMTEMPEIAEKAKQRVLGGGSAVQP
jgi:hypothetical protein